MKKVFLVMFCLASTAYAAEKFDLLNFDFIAPVVNSESDVPKQAGLIFYDVGSGLKIVNPSGSVEVISATGVTGVSSGGSSERIERVLLNCDSDSNDTPSQSGTWVTGVTNINTSSCDMSITGFTNTPFCVANKKSCSTTGGTDCFLTIPSATNTTVTVKCIPDTGSHACNDFDAYVICMGN